MGAAEPALQRTRHNAPLFVVARARPLAQHYVTRMLASRDARIFMADKMLTSGNRKAPSICGATLTASGTFLDGT